MFIEHVNSQGTENFLKDLRGMIALECTMKQRGLKAEYFILVLRESLSTYLLNRPIADFIVLCYQSVHIIIIIFGDGEPLPSA
jgi:hypothetical protein